MKLLIASDLHGSSYYVSKLEEIIEKECPDKIILLGDLLYHGPRNSLPEEYDTMKVITILNKYKDSILAVRGNCDAEVDQMVLEFSIMDDYKLIEVDDLKLYLTHGHINHKIPYQDGILVHGHTHEYELSSSYINPGSISIPKVHEEHTYIIYENRCFRLYDIEGNVIKELVI